MSETTNAAADCGCGSGDPLECARLAAKSAEIAHRQADETRQKLAAFQRQAAEFLLVGGRERIKELEKGLRAIRDGKLTGPAARAVAAVVLNED